MNTKLYKRIAYTLEIDYRLTRKLFATYYKQKEIKLLEDYKDNQFWLMKGDCLERMKEIESGTVDLILHRIS